MKKKFRDNWPFLVLVALALITRFAFLSYPSEVVFDEVHFGKFVSGYFTHKYYFDIHPPLGKMLIAGFAEVAGFQLQGQDPDKIFEHIGSQFSQNDFLILRFLPALAGVLLVIVIYRLILSLGLSRSSAVLGSSLTLFDNAILTQSKFILVDAFLILFGFLGLLLYSIARKKSGAAYYIYLILSGISLACAFSIKWTGLSFFAVIIFFALLDSLKNFKTMEFLKKMAILILIPVLVYVLVFFINFKILYKSGTGDAFMSQNFQRTLEGNTVPANIAPLGFFGKLIELNVAMYKYNAGLTATHPFSSKWYQWPLGYKPIWYWTKTVDNSVANIYIFGNPVVWIGVFVAIIAALLSIIKLRIAKIAKNRLLIVLMFGYFISILPFIGITRVTFLYHYFPSLIFGILILSLFHENMLAKNKRVHLYRRAYLVLVASIFLIMCPLNYGFPVSTGLTGFYNWFIKLLS